MVNKTTDNRMQWQVDEEIVISGISGRFPESDNIDELKDNLYGYVLQQTNAWLKQLYKFHDLIFHYQRSGYGNSRRAQMAFR